MPTRSGDFPPGVDPRLDASDDAPAIDSGGQLRPTVAGAATGASLWLVGGGAAFLGLLAFLWLSSHRAVAPRDLSASGASSPATPLPPPVEPPAAIDAMEAASRGVHPTAPPPPVAVAIPVAPAPIVAAALPPPTPAPEGKTPVLVVDLASPPGVAAVGAAGAAATAAGGRASGPNGLNGDEQFAARVESAQPERSRATVLRNQSTTAPQGTIIPAVLETALNSDLPGFTRAVVSRDVRSFDGSRVLIPRGSRLIGEYHNAATLGQSRVFVIWTRVLRPDGVSIQIGSAGGDSLGRAGLGGTVDRHFFERFSGAILLSVVDAGIAALSRNQSTQVIVGSSSDASGVGGAASAFAPANISPTIKVPQGTPIRIIVARDLDFTPVQEAGE